MDGNLFALLAVTVVGATGALWFQRMQAVRTAEVRSLVIGAMGLGALLAVAAFMMGAGLLGKIGAGLALALSGTFLFLQPFAGQSRTPPKTGVGERIIEFSAVDDGGAEFALSSLSGKPYLLKFFRGHW